jgi:hydrogenase maturation protein HypF
MIVRHRLRVRGVVQGVGFRPYVYRLAQQFQLAGFIRNTSSGALIEIEGAAAAAASFLEVLPQQGPPLMRIASMQTTNLALLGEETFAIRESEIEASASACVPPDVSVCEACIADTCDPADRRFEYPFTNCTNCGPRYSIILDLPYDRAQTTMAGFAMCDQCRAEYDNPEDRRFHAQPNACPVCGPHLWLTDRCGEELPVHGTRAALEAVVAILRSAGIVAWKGLGGYQLACDANNDGAVRELRQRKHRNEKPFALMVRDTETASTLCEISDQERSILESPEKPIILLCVKPSAAIAASVAPGMSSLGVMLPYTPMHELLFRIMEERCGPGAALVMTSGNMSEEPILIHEQDAQEQLRGVADLFVHHNRPIHTRVDDSVVRVAAGKQTLWRRARGYTPSVLRIGQTPMELLACGAQQKSAFCLARDGSAILSQHLGDLDNYETLEFFEQTLERMCRLFQITPRAVAYDLHPRYASTRWASKLDVAHRIGVQHHHAHIVSCMAEHGLEGSVLGVAWDGTGFGSDGTVWGGEFLITERSRFERYAHLRNISLAGGDLAVREPWRAARSYVLDAFDNVALREVGWHNSIPSAKVRMLDALLEKRIHIFETSSCGRLFDAVASLVGLHQTVSYEGQAAAALEAIADSSSEAYEFAIAGTRPAQVDMRPTVRQIVEERQGGVPVSAIAARFHNTLVEVVGEVCVRMRQQTGLTRVCLSGGCFQNARLLGGCVHRLRSDAFEVFFQQQVPANDGGIALGQAAIASALLRRGA